MIDITDVKHILLKNKKHPIFQEGVKNGMKPIKLNIITLIILILLTACGAQVDKHTISSDQLILSESYEINYLQINYKQEKFNNYTDKKIIDAMVEKLGRFKVSKLTHEERDELFEKRDVEYSIFLSIVFGEPEEGLDILSLGAVFIFTTGEVVFFEPEEDTNSMYESYIHVKKDKKMLDGIISFIQSLEE